MSLSGNVPLANGMPSKGIQKRARAERKGESTARTCHKDCASMPPWQPYAKKMQQSVQKRDKRTSCEQNSGLPMTTRQTST
mmetsp:Transcript_99525/g.156970  ORF Transcript_99525/g.156970 Transcript_99525/m.156970 type:complete len:81 (-) Transcript_99525:2750-2992(-)